MSTVTDSGLVLRSVNPATLETVGTVSVSTAADVAACVLRASEAQLRWRTEPLRARAALARRVGHALLEDADAIAALIVAETGKPTVEAFTSELFPCLEAADWLARNLTGALRPERVPMRRLLVPQKRAQAHWRPVGVVGIVSAWNYPLGVPLTQALFAVAAGNAAVVKPSELTPLTGAWIEGLFERAGAPPGLVTVVQGPGETVGDALVSCDGVGHVVFTGSAEVGRGVAARCSERLCPVTLELGGKDPMLVLDDADVSRAVGGALWGAFTNAGQVCSGIERAYVAAPLYDEFVSRLALAADGLRVGCGDDPRTEMGPLISDGQRARVEALVADAVEHGASVIAGGGRPAALELAGWFHEPTVLVGEPTEARIAREEIFGPVVTVVRIDDESDGIRLANASPYALGASVWTRDRDRARRVGARLRAGSVWMNDHAYSYGVCAAPWGGVGGSGHGRTHSRHGLHGLSTLSFVDSDAGRLRPPWWYPYTAGTIDGFRAAAAAVYGRDLGSRLTTVVRERRALAALARSTRRRG